MKARGDEEGVGEKVCLNPHIYLVQNTEALSLVTSLWQNQKCRLPDLIFSAEVIFYVHVYEYIYINTNIYINKYK